MGNAAIAGIQASNAESQRKQQAKPAPSLLSADNPHSGVDPVAAFLSGPYAYTGEGAEMLAGYSPFNGPLLASSDRASMLAGVYGPAGYPPLTAAQAADVRSMQSSAPWLNSGEWSSDVFQSYIDANGDVNVIGNPVYDASGMPVMQNGQQVVVVPGGASVTPSAEVLAQLQAESAANLPPVENWYTPRVGYFENAYNYYMAGAADSQASVGQRSRNLVEALATVPLALPDMAISGVYNAGNSAALAGQEIARARMLSGSDSTLGYLHGGQHLLDGFLGLGSAAAGATSFLRGAAVRPVTANPALVIPGEVAATAGAEQEAIVANYLRAQYGAGNVGEQVYLEAVFKDGTSVRFRPDALVDLRDGTFQVFDAKMSFTKNLTTADLMGTFKPNQRIAFSGIADGSATIRLTNSKAGQMFFGKDFEVGKVVRVRPQVQIFVNAPEGQVLRTFP